MRGAALLALAVAACGPGPARSTSGGPVANVIEVSPGGGATVVTAPAMCDRIYQLADTGCLRLERYGLGRDECIADFDRSLTARGEDARTATVAVGHCLLDQLDCDAALRCVDALDQDADAHGGRPSELRTCEERDRYAPVGVTAEAWAQRKGAGVIRYRHHDSSKDDPIAVCGMPAQLTWLLGATCDDGSRPFRNADQAHASRVGNVGAGGPCGSIIDLYEVACPEGTYAIYIDAYVCPLP